VRSAWLARTVLALLLLVLCSASVLLWYQLEKAQQERLQERVGYQARTLARQLENTLNNEVESLRRIARLWNRSNRLPESQWQVEANIALEGFNGYQSIQWIGPDLHMRWLLPLEGNEAAQHFVLTPKHPNYPLAMEAKASGAQRLSNSVELVQGGLGFVLYTPLFIQNVDGQPTFDGFMQGVFRVEPLMNELLNSIDSQSFSIQLLESGRVIYSHGQPDAHRLERQVPLQLLNNRNFSLQLSPTHALLEQLSSPLPIFVLGAGLAVSLLLTITTALAMENARRANALQQANRSLKREASRREQVEQSLLLNRERQQLILDLTDTSRDSLFIFDTADRELLHMNQATYASLGYRPEQFAQLLKEHPEQVLPGFDDWLELVREAQRDNQSRIFQREMRRRDGSSQPAEISTHLVESNGREYLIGVSRDNSERLELEERLHRLSQQDGLTGLHNRRFFDQQLHAEWRRLRRLGAPLALLLVDIDHFKTYNDALGHLAGDDALRRVSTVLQACLQREGDVACRYGGEEFAIILPNTMLEGGEYVATQMHEGVAELGIAHPASPFGQLTLSIGLAIGDPLHEEQPGHLVGHSDQALYRAKHAGRNRTCVWTADMAGRTPAAADE
jgi:diguanylate cyclase (GGDEF)-like protein/PAS domain S-box-containing protein